METSITASPSTAKTLPRSKTRWGVHLALILVCFLLAFPLLYALVMATMTIEQAYRPPNEVVIGNDLWNNIRELFTEENFSRYFWNTSIVALVVVIGKTGFAMLAGLAFVYFQFPGRWVLFFFVLFTLLMPTEIIILPLFRVIADLEWGSNNPRLAMTIPFLASGAGTFLFRQHFSNIPREMLEAAQLDGASPLRFMWSVLLPMSWNVIAAHCVLQFIYMWHQYLWPVIVLQNTKDQLIQQGVRNTAGFSTQTDYGLLMAAGLVASLPPLIVFIVLQKQFMSGFALTRDK